MNANDTQPFERMSQADQHAVRLHLRMMIMQVREMPTREARVKHMVGQTFLTSAWAGCILHEP